MIFSPPFRGDKKIKSKQNAPAGDFDLFCGKTNQTDRAAFRAARRGAGATPPRRPRFLPHPLSKAGRGKERGSRADFLSGEKQNRRSIDANGQMRPDVCDGMQRDRVHERGGRAARRLEAGVLQRDRAVSVRAAEAPLPDGSEPRGHDENQGREDRRGEMEDHEWNRCS